MIRWKMSWSRVCKDLKNKNNMWGQWRGDQRGSWEEEHKVGTEEDSKS
jgi:hypothetical protein